MRSVCTLIYAIKIYICIMPCSMRAYKSHSLRIQPNQVRPRIFPILGSLITTEQIKSETKQDSYIRLQLSPRQRFLEATYRDPPGLEGERTTKQRSLRNKLLLNHFILSNGRRDYRHGKTNAADNASQDKWCLGHQLIGDG